MIFREHGKRIILTKEIVKTATEKVHEGVRHSLALSLERCKGRFKEFPLSGINLAAVTDDVVEFDLSAKINSENLVSIEVKLDDFSFDKPIRFDVSINTHQGSLDFDLTKISHLRDDEANIYQPLSWEGSPPGGHHRSGTLTFPRLSEKTKFIKLIIKDVNNVPERVFRWESS